MTINKSNDITNISAISPHNNPMRQLQNQRHRTIDIIIHNLNGMNAESLASGVSVAASLRRQLHELGYQGKEAKSDIAIIEHVDGRLAYAQSGLNLVRELVEFARSDKLDTGDRQRIVEEVESILHRVGSEMLMPASTNNNMRLNSSVTMTDDGIIQADISLTLVDDDGNRKNINIDLDEEDLSNINMLTFVEKFRQAINQADQNLRNELLSSLEDRVDEELDTIGRHRGNFANILATLRGRLDLIADALQTKKEMQARILSTEDAREALAEARAKAKEQASQVMLAQSTLEHETLVGLLL